MPKRVPFTLQLSIYDQDIIDWLQGLERRTRGRKVKAAIRARINSSVTLDAHLAILSEQIEQLRETSRQFEGWLERAHAGPSETNMELATNSNELAPDLVKNVVGSFKPGRKAKNGDGE
jgi:hypothetical protein